MKLTKKDYKDILKYYKVPRSNNRSKNMKLAEHLLATKLCRCIKKVQKTSALAEPAAIGICTKSIFKTRNLKYHRFTCKKGYKIKGNKKHPALYKTNTLKLRATKKRR